MRCFACANWAPTVSSSSFGGDDDAGLDSIGNLFPGSEKRTDGWMDDCSVGPIENLEIVAVIGDLERLVCVS